MITYKQANNLQYLHADSLDTAVAVWEHLVGKCDRTYAKDYILENQARFSSHKFVKVMD